MADTGYESDMAYLAEKAEEGTLLASNAIYKKLDSKRNVPEVKSFLERKIDPKIKG